MKYKINLHAHTIFSDGYNSPLKMGMTAKELGFTALVITDHYRNDAPYSSYNFSLCQDACCEVKEIIPVILGMEIMVEGVEMLLFGGEAIKIIRGINERSLQFRDVWKIRNRTHCATILCHPGRFTDAHADLVDGYERINSMQDWFKRDRDLGGLEGKQAWCNSDAHAHNNLANCYNLVGSKIENETDLIKYIKRGKQPEFYVKEA